MLLCAVGSWESQVCTRMRLPSRSLSARQPGMHAGVNPMGPLLQLQRQDGTPLFDPATAKEQGGGAAQGTPQSTKFSAGHSGSPDNEPLNSSTKSTLYHLRKVFNEALTFPNGLLSQQDTTAL